MLGFLIRWGAPLLLVVFPLPVVAQLVVVILRSLAKRTNNKLDDELVDVLVKHLGIPEETKEVPNDVGRGQ